ncbi:cytochrome c biogenesis protein CcsA [Bacillaceae bacterium Marseille-Q3522]|nr:cytochrome c biogenesis protein CcsA [Bacillaceae bacterium Marseille-Q3522]
MLEIHITRIHEGIVVLYALSVFLYFVDYLQHNQRAKKTAFWLLTIVWVLQTFSFFYYMLQTGRFPILTMLEGLYFYAWVLITLSLILNRIIRVEFLAFFTNVLAFLVIAVHTFSPPASDSAILADQLISELLFIHITVAILSYGAFTLSFVVSLLYFIQYDLLKRKKWGTRLKRIPDLAKLEQMSFLLIIIGVPLLLISLILGFVWAYMVIPQMRWYDPKVVGSVFVFAMYGLYIYKKRSGTTGMKLVILNTAGFFALLINFFLTGKFSSFHL